MRGTAFRTDAAASLSGFPPHRRDGRIRHRSFATTAAAYGGKLLPETLGAGCAFIDYDADGWPDILLVNGMDWPGHKRQRSTLGCTATTATARFRT